MLDFTIYFLVLFAPVLIMMVCSYIAVLFYGHLSKSKVIDFYTVALITTSVAVISLPLMYHAFNKQWFVLLDQYSPSQEFLKTIMIISLILGLFGPLLTKSLLKDNNQN